MDIAITETTFDSSLPIGSVGFAQASLEREHATVADCIKQIAYYDARILALAITGEERELWETVALRRHEVDRRNRHQAYASTWVENVRVRKRRLNGSLV